MDSRQAHNPRIGRERAVYDYLESLESGDIDGLIDVLQQALYDATLDEMVIEAHQAYFQEEQARKAALVDLPTQEMLALEPATLRSQVLGQRRRTGVRQMSRWAQALAAVLILGVLAGSFLTVLALRQQGQQGRQGAPTPPPACQSYPLKQFDAQNHGTTADSLSSLESITVVSANNAWAVGSSSSPPTAQHVSQSTFIEHWDGKSWQIVASADATGSLNAVAAVSATDVWAVGSFTQGTTTQGSAIGSNLRTLIEHWDGLRWRVVPGPNSADGNGSLNSLVVVSATDIWAVGSFVDAKLLLSHPLLERWDGTGWQVVPLQGRNAATLGWLSSVAATSANDVWAVGLGRSAGETQGHGLLEHWNGKQWQSEPVPQGIAMLNSVSTLSAQNLWAAGSDLQGNALIEQWNGRQWSTVALPGSLARAKLNLRITAISLNDVWAVGSVKGSDLGSHLLILHWNGKSWQQITPPVLQLPATLPNSTASGIAIYGGRQIWIVGSARDTEGGYSSALILGQLTCP